MTVLLTDLHTLLISFINNGVNKYRINRVEINQQTPLSDWLSFAKPNADCNKVKSKTKYAQFFNIAINNVLP
jgi:predicted ATPase